jgi:release factor glutamine methyltransferase
MIPAGEALRRGAERLSAAGIGNARLEARLLLAHALGVTAEALLRDRSAPVGTAAYEALLARRAAREPLALILGHREFWSLDLAVSPATLVPRADTETLIEAALAARPDRVAVRRILDLGTGTGCLVLAALGEFPAAFGIGVDIEPQAAALAAANAGRVGLADRAAFICGSWAEALAGPFDLVLCNPPYIPSGDIPGLMPEVAAHEPRRALDGGPDGLDAYRRILAGLPRLLPAGGVAVLELGQGQADPVAALARREGLAVDGVRPDLSGIPRAMALRAAGLERAAKKPFGRPRPGV